ncbi:hypothetical protein JQK15_03995 [Sphingobium sp. BHU LFT2]|uniref:hypothetical protein n=1 Tax=Sphingobium sp. BHU LFT2 TaxID=2807634 RepID=UPI001BECF650|nr:hypothetical protein [Sphingobium sp. BHU LFT2]MBT2242691.1 hypothetical protein [Sphingobium sp. BHU LFT2]
MKVITDAGVIEIGATETAPTIGITDYSRRETDDFGVTTVVRRNFSRRMSVRVMVPTDQVDGLQRQLAALRATAVQWVADDRFDSLSIMGFYKDLTLDLALPPVSYCTLTIEGLAEGGDYVDDGSDPTPDARTSTLRLLQPLTIDDDMLWASTVVEDDYPAWAAGTAYPLGARVLLGNTHRIYESAIDDNLGNDPVSSGQWLDIAPTNRWAMFDQALGSLTEADDDMIITLKPDRPINAVALLDVTADSVRVHGVGYDRTLSPASVPGAVTFLDLPANDGALSITIAGTGTVSVGTLLIGNLLGLGITEASPTAAITDYSRKETDDFGEVTVVQRAWAKRMEVRGLIDTGAVDTVAGRLANVRATPSLWIGDASLESLAVYGFFKDFSIEIAENVSTLSLSIEGLSAAAKIAPLIPAPDIGWTDVKDDDPAHPKPEDGATVGAPDWAPVADTTAGNVLDALKALASVTDPDEIVAGALALVDRQQDHELALMLLGAATAPGDILSGVQALLDRVSNHGIAIYDAQLLGEERKARWERLTHLDGIEITTRVRSEIDARIEGDTAIVERVNEIEATATDGISAAMAAISDEAIVRASADAAETSQRETAVSLLHTRIDDEIIDVQAAIASEASTRATADAAETAQREAAVSLLHTRIDDEVVEIQSAITAEATTRATADAAETAQRELAISQIQTTIGDEITTVMAAIATEQTTRADADAAEAALRVALAASMDSQFGAVDAAILEESSARVSGDEAEASARQALAALISGDIGDVSSALEAEAVARASADAAETTQRQQAISQVNLRVDDEVVDLQAAILAEATTRSDADAAETAQREAAISTLQGVVNGNHADVTASISSEATTRANADAAETAARNLAISTLESDLDGQISTVMAAISSEASTRAAADSAETTAREQAISQVEDMVDGEIATVMAAIVAEQSTRADADLAEASARQALASSISGELANINAAILSEANTRASADSAEATAREALAATLSGDIGAVSAAVETEATARAAEDGALASLISGVQTTVEGNTASVALLLESVDGLNASLVARIVSGDVIGGFQLAAGGGEIDAKFLVDNFSVVNPAGDGWEFSGGRQVTTGGSIMSITGAPFGSTNQFLEWTGPVVSDLADCTEANAIKFMKIDGSAYFGGGLSSGILKNEATSTVVSPTAFVTVGPFTSNGNTVNINISARYHRDYRANSGTGGISGSGSGVITVEHSADGTNWTSIGTMGVAESLREVVVDGEPGVPDLIQWEMSGAATLIWNPGPLSGLFIRARWTSRIFPAFNGTPLFGTNERQSVTIIAVETP